ncbi:MAG: nucleotidyltransferase family protein [Tabrizicola sp.]|uniref:nucleotidyltransferase family protein n=1 Tax=Tabrizicola sp. TaxID=2005166 RepID=UPI002ABA44F9|nr:nucleotidyltransferase family protein [Tabrizicola sp.]MDZ4087424.1 nucleotidyltransferase family protein [Tabrizicola sp.]
MRPTVHILVLAAGASSRMRGADKLLQAVKGRPILRLVAETALASGAPVLVTLPPTSEARRAAVADLAVRVVDIPDAAQGMSRSIIRGLAAVVEPGPEDGLMILPADMPGFSAKALADLISRFRAEPELIWRGGTTDGTPGHPAIIPRDLWPELAAITGDEGGRSVLKRHADRVRQVPLPGRMATLDLDTPEDWTAFRSRPAP